MPNRAGPPPVQNQQRGVVVWEQNFAVVKKALDDRAEQFDALLGRENRERWLAVALHALGQQKNLLRDCTPLSVVEAVRESAALNLSPTGLLGEGWILPYGDTAKFQPGYRGYLKLLRNSGQIKTVDSQIVYMNDEFSVQLGTDPKIHHVPVLYGEKNDAGVYLAERGDYRGVYAWVRMTSGETVIEWMSWDDVMKIRALSPSVQRGKPSPWDDHAGEMARKTVLRRLMKRLPLDSMPHVAHAATLDEEADVIEGSAVEVPDTRSSAATAAAYALARGATDDPAEAQGTEQTDSAPAGAATVGQVIEAVHDLPDGEEGPACLDPSPYDDGDVCRKRKGHPGNHQSPGGTW